MTFSHRPKNLAVFLLSHLYRLVVFFLLNPDLIDISQNLFHTIEINQITFHRTTDPTISFTASMVN